MLAPIPCAQDIGDRQLSYRFRLLQRLYDKIETKFHIKNLLDSLSISLSLLSFDNSNPKKDSLISPFQIEVLKWHN